MKFELEAEHKTELVKICKSGMSPVDLVKRAKILLKKAEGKSAESIADELAINRHTVDLWVRKYRQRRTTDTIKELLSVSSGRGRKDDIPGEAKTWLISVACQKPKDLGYAAETWTNSALTQHIREHAKDAGFERLATISESSVFSILNKNNIKPFKIRYYCERRDPDFKDKMHNVLLVYKQLSFQFDEDGNLHLPYENEMTTHVLSYDEKPGIQAISNTSEDLLPNKENGVIMRDYEYKRLGTLSLLAGIDLQTGEAIPLVSETHTSDDYIEFLKILDSKYPKGDKIRLVLDNLKVHTSDKVKEYIKSTPDRFEFVFTPKHASWLNLVEGFFSKMTKQMLRGIRVKTKQELSDRIYKYFEEINQTPIVYHWTWNLDDIDEKDEVKVTTYKNV